MATPFLSPRIRLHRELDGLAASGSDRRQRQRLHGSARCPQPAWGDHPRFRCSRRAGFRDHLTQAHLTAAETIPTDCRNCSSSGSTCPEFRKRSVPVRVHSVAKELWFTGLSRSPASNLPLTHGTVESPSKLAQPSQFGQECGRLQSEPRAVPQLLALAGDRSPKIQC